MPNPVRAGDGKPRVSNQYHQDPSGLRESRVAAGGCAKLPVVIRLFLLEVVMRVSYSVNKRAGSVSRPHRIEFCVFPAAVAGRLGVVALVLACLLGVLAPIQLHAQNVTLVPYITTIAGNGTLGYAGDNGPATSAKLVPVSVTVDRAGNIYIADQNSCVRVVNNQPSAITVLGVTIRPGNIATVAGTGTQGYSGDNGPATSAKLNNPYGVTVDRAGNIYIADTENNRIRVVNTQSFAITVLGVTIDPGYIATVVGNGTSGYSGDNGAAINAELMEPTGVALDGSGNLYIADRMNDRVRKVNSGGIITTVAGNGQACSNPASGCGDGDLATSAQLYWPRSVVADGSGNIFIGDMDDSRVRAVNTHAGAVTVLGVNIAGGDIATVAGNGIFGYLGDGQLAVNAELKSPYGVALDSAGNLYIADESSQRVRKV